MHHRITYTYKTLARAYMFVGPIKTQTRTLFRGGCQWSPSSHRIPEAAQRRKPLLSGPCHTHNTLDNRYEGINSNTHTHTHVFIHAHPHTCTTHTCTCTLCTFYTWIYMNTHVHCIHKHTCINTHAYTHMHAPTQVYCIHIALCSGSNTKSTVPNWR